MRTDVPVETHQIKAYLKTGNDRLAKTKLKAIMARYPQRRFTIECTMLFAKICFTRGEFDEALHVIDQLPDSCASSQEMLLYSAQAGMGLKITLTCGNGKRP